jgi:hypothetical protein
VPMPEPPRLSPFSSKRVKILRPFASFANNKKSAFDATASLSL